MRHRPALRHCQFEPCTLFLLLLILLLLILLVLLLHLLLLMVLLLLLILRLLLIVLLTSTSGYLSGLEQDQRGLGQDQRPEIDSNDWATSDRAMLIISLAR